MTAAEVKRRVAKCLAQNPGDPSQWFEAVMVDPSGLTLTRADLDSMLSSRPLLLSGSDGHTAWANSKALALAHIDASTPDPAGGHIERDAAGNPTGTRSRDNANLAAYAAKLAASLDAGESARQGSGIDARRQHHLGAGRGGRRRRDAHVRASVRRPSSRHAGAGLRTTSRICTSNAQDILRRATGSAPTGRSILDFLARRRGQELFPPTARHRISVADRERC